MATNVLVIPEDFRKDQYVLKPIVEKMLLHLGINARVVVCKDPLLRGISQALDWAEIEPILARYKGMTDLFLLIVDRDCEATRSERIRALEAKASEHLGGRSVFLGENAWQEIEVWVLAGAQDLPSEWKWSAVRSHRDPKEAYYDAYAKQRNVLQAPYEGRDTLAKEAARNYKRLRQLCPEDVQNLEGRVAAALRGAAARTEGRR